MGGQVSAIREAWPARSHFNVEDIPDLTGKVIVVTGANTGIGKETAKALLSHGAKVYVASRSQEKSDAAIRDLESQTGQKALSLQLDLGDLSAIKSAAEDLLSKEKEIHVLYNNAGVMFPPANQLTAQGYDLQFGTNVLGHAYFTMLLLPALLAGAKSSPDGKARVINVSSSGHNLLPSLDFNTFKDGPTRKKLSTEQLYGQSKFGNVMFANELHRRYADKGIMSCSLNPGNIRSDLQRHMGGIGKTVLWYLTYPTPYGALTQLWAGTSKEGVNLGGKYLGPWARIRVPNSKTHDEELGKQLWKWVEDQVQNV